MAYINGKEILFSAQVNASADPTDVKYLIERNTTDVSSYEIPDYITIIGDGAFSYWGISEIKLHDKITKIGGKAFSHCEKITQIDIPTSVTSIGDGAFEYTGITEITLPDSLSEIGIGNTMFQYSKKLERVVLPKTIKTIGNYFFYYCQALKNVEIPTRVTMIGQRAFGYCEALTSITIPANVSTIDAYAFNNLGTTTDKATITMLRSTPPTLKASNVFTTARLNKIIVPAGCGDAYKSATNWSALAAYIEEATE